MERWKYKSLEWIHKVREDDYEKTQGLSPKELIERTRQGAEAVAKKLGLKVVPPKTTARHG